MSHSGFKYLIVAAILVALFGGWKVAESSRSKRLASAEWKAAEPPQAKPTKPPTWVGPTGTPVQRFDAAKTEEERELLISQFMALGHEENPQMLIAALKDGSKRIRMYAIEQVSMLEEVPAAEVLKEGCLSEDPAVRDMAWSLLAPYPTERRTPALMASVERGSDQALEEALEEMGRVPEITVFEAMLASGKRVTGPRQQRVLNELQAWLVPGGGDVPKFTSPEQLSQWWQINKQAYDPWMLRVDQ